MNNRKRRLGRKLLLAPGFLVAALALLPAYVRAYTLSGTSAAPTLLLGDWVWVDHSAYDIRFPYCERVLLTRGDPALGELIPVLSPELSPAQSERAVRALSTGRFLDPEGSQPLQQRPKVRDRISLHPLPDQGAPRPARITPGRLRDRGSPPLQDEARPRALSPDAETAEEGARLPLFLGHPAGQRSDSRRHGARIRRTLAAGSRASTSGPIVSRRAKRSGYRSHSSSRARLQPASTMAMTRPASG